MPLPETRAVIRASSRAGSKSGAGCRKAGGGASLVVPRAPGGVTGRSGWPRDTGATAAESARDAGAARGASRAEIDRSSAMRGCDLPRSAGSAGSAGRPAATSFGTGVAARSDADPDRSTVVAGPLAGAGIGELAWTRFPRASSPGSDCGVAAVGAVALRLWSPNAVPAGGTGRSGRPSTVEMVSGARCRAAGTVIEPRAGGSPCLDGSTKRRSIRDPGSDVPASGGAEADGSALTGMSRSEARTVSRFGRTSKPVRGSCGTSAAMAVALFPLSKAAPVDGTGAPRRPSEVDAGSLENRSGSAAEDDGPGGDAAAGLGFGSGHGAAVDA